jgi:hypothetical protein
MIDILTRLLGTEDAAVIKRLYPKIRAELGARTAAAPGLDSDVESLAAHLGIDRGAARLIKARGTNCGDLSHQRRGAV